MDPDVIGCISNNLYIGEICMKRFISISVILYLMFLAVGAWLGIMYMAYFN